MLGEIMNNPITLLVLAIISVVGFGFAIFEYYKNKKFKELSHYDTNFTVIENGRKSISKVSVMYDGEEVENVTVSKFAIWNSGTETIKCDDLVSLIQIKAKNDVEFLDAIIIGETDKDNEFFIKSSDKSTVTIDFRYADPKDGCVIQLVHSGNASDILIYCKMMGGEDFKKITPFKGILNNKKKKLKGKNKLKSLVPLLIVYPLVLDILVVINSIIVFSKKAKDLLYEHHFGIKFSDIKKLEPVRQLDILNKIFDYNIQSNNVSAVFEIVVSIVFTIFCITLCAIIIRGFSLSKIPRKLRPYILREYIKDKSKYYDED